MTIGTGIFFSVCAVCITILIMVAFSNLSEYLWAMVGDLFEFEKRIKKMESRIFKVLGE